MIYNLSIIVLILNKKHFNDYLKIGIESGLCSMIIYILIIGCALVNSFSSKNIWSHALISYSIFALFYYPSQLNMFNILLPLLFLL